GRVHIMRRSEMCPLSLELRSHVPECPEGAYLAAFVELVMEMAGCGNRGKVKPRLSRYSHNPWKPAQTAGFHISTTTTAAATRYMPKQLNRQNCGVPLI